MPDREIHPLASVFPPMPDDQYQALLASVRQHGVRQPVTLIDGAILDGVHRARAHAEAERPEALPTQDLPDGEDPVRFVVDANANRRHLTESQRAMVAARIANLGEGRPKKETGSIEPVSQADAADALSVSVPSIKRAVAIKDDHVLAPAVASGEVTVADAYSARHQSEAAKAQAVEALKAGRYADGKALPDRPTVTKVARRIDRDAEREYRRVQANRAIAEEGPTAGLFACAVKDLHQHVAAGSVDYIVTDPPYMTEYVEAGVYGDLGLFAEHALRPGGLLLCIVPQAHLLAALRQLSVSDLRYRWLLAYTQQRGRRHVDSARVTVKWKPWAAYVKRGGKPQPYAADLIDAGRYEADQQGDHEWGQTVGGMRSVIAEWCQDPGIVCDPFCGAGSMLVAARSLGHKVIGADIDAGHVATTKEALK